MREHKDINLRPSPLFEILEEATELPLEYQKYLLYMAKGMRFTRHLIEHLQQNKHHTNNT